MARPISELLSKGQSVLVKGNKGSYQVATSIKKNVFKAHTLKTSTPVILKTELEENDPIYEQELSAYEFNCIQKSPYIRSLHEVIDNGTDKCMVFQWMDSDLWSLREKRHKLNPKLPKIVAKSVLRALTAFNDMDGQGAAVHTDVNPNNILVDKADEPSTIVKLSDLGGSDIVAGAYEEHGSRLQGFAIRAPEIWMGKAPSPACDVWSLGVSLVHFLTIKPFFGPSDMTIRLPCKPHEMTQAAWSIGKIMRLFGRLPRYEDPGFTEEFSLAETLVKREIIKIGPFKEEMSKFDVSEDCVQFLQHLLNIDP